MPQLKVRQSLIEAATHSGMLTNLSKNEIRDFLDGIGDIRLTSIDTESLAILEFCILLEESYGLSITPRDFYSYETLAAVAEYLGNDEHH
jgi:acyl carrier protein